MAEQLFFFFFFFFFFVFVFVFCMGLYVRVCLASLASLSLSLASLASLSVLLIFGPSVELNSDTRSSQLPESKSM